MSPIVEDRLAQIASQPLLSGAHDSPAHGLCVMEAVAFIAGEEHSDQPACACPVIGAFLRSWNDAIPDDDARTALLRPFVARLVGSRSTPEVEQRRADLALDWLIRVHAAAWLELSPTLQPHATALRALPPLLSVDALDSAQPVLSAAAKEADAAWAAARDAASDAASDAAWDAAWDAASDAARVAARAAYTKAAAGTGYAAAYSAAKPVCVALFAPVRATLERSALALIDTMLAVTPESLRAEERA